MLRNMLGSLLALVALVACSGKDGGDGGSSGPSTTGCLQGVVINGLTSERISLPTADDKGLRVLVRDDLRAGSSLVDDPKAEGANPLLAGEYYMCNVPLDEDFPVFVWVDGFEPFEGQVRVHSTAASRSPKATADLLKPYPTEIANIRLYPKNTQVKDLGVLVVSNGAPVAGAQVVLRSRGDNFLDPLRANFLTPRVARAQSQSQTTGEDGKATFAAAELVLGGYYTYTVLPPEGGTKQAATAGTFVLGLRSESSASDPYQINVNLDQSVGALAVLSRSTESEDPNAGGVLTVYFNREFEIVPGTEDEIQATLSGATTAALEANVAGNKRADNVTVTIEANKLTLAPVFKTKPNGDTSKEPDLAITYSGLHLRPKEAPDTLSAVDVSDTVHFYR